jgi:hypothetical protein
MLRSATGRIVVLPLSVLFAGLASLDTVLMLVLTGIVPEAGAV